MAIRAPADKRFRRAHVTPVRRRRSRGRRSLRLLRAALVFAAAAYVGYRIVSMVLGAPALRIDRIVVRGNERLSVGEVQALMGSIRGESILLADLDAGRQKLIMSPWVSDVALRRVLPSTIEVVVSERNPLGLGRLAGQLYLVDGRGTIIDEYGPQFADFDLPIIDGLSTAPQGARPVVDGARADLAARLIEEVRGGVGLAERISQIDVRDAGDVVVMLSGDSAVLHLGHERFLERLESYIELAPTLRAHVPEIDSVDLRFDERVYVRPARADRGASGWRPVTTGAEPENHP